MTLRLASIGVACWLMLSLTMGGTPPRAGQRRGDQEPTITLESSLVLVTVTVTSRDQRYVARLTVKDFTLFEDGRPQEIVHFGAEETPFAAAILLDVSGSMERMVGIGRAAARGFAHGLRPEDVFAVYVFSHRCALVQEFGSYPEVDSDLWRIRAEGMTALYDCLIMAAEALGRREEKRRAILLLSDGADTASRASLDEALAAILDQAVIVYAVDLMEEQRMPAAEALRARGALQMLAEKTGGRYIRDPGGVYASFEQIVEELGHQYTLGYYPSPPRRDGRWHEIRVTVSRPGATVRARTGYRAPRPRPSS
jgi:Ca-activated chloride channel family protein